jgi:tetratricopeptide (TPR) repeat protein
MIWTASTLLGQSKAELNIDDAISKKQWKRALSLSESAIKKPESSKMAWAWFGKAKALYEMSRDQDYVRKNPSASKEAVKAALKAKNFDAKGDYSKRYATLLRDLKDQNNKEAWANYGQERFSRAIQTFKLGYELYGDTLSYAMVGVSYMRNGDIRDAIPMLKTAIRWNTDAFHDSVLLHTMVREPFEHLAKYYMDNNMYDSARSVVESGMQVFPKNPLIQEMQVKLLRHEIRTTPISQPQIMALNKALDLRPNDSFFLYSQNAYYLFRIRNAANSGELPIAETLIDEFALDKKKLYLRGARNGYDAFLLPFESSVLNLAWQYYAERNAFTAAALCYRAMLARRCDKCELPIPISPSMKLDSLPVGMVHAWTLLDGMKKPDEMKQFRLKYFQGLRPDSLPYVNMAALVKLSEDLIKEFPKDVKLKPNHELLLVKWLDLAVRKPDMSGAWVAYRKLEAFNPASKQLDASLQKLVVADFTHGYFGTRLKDYKWNGSTTMCMPGTIEESVHDRVEERINYFRRNAGILDPIILSPEKNRMSQQAALCWELTGTASHTVDKFHRCFTEEAALAAKNSIPISGVNTVIGVSSAMDDNENKSVGNRRWLLNPTAYAFGHGSTKSFTALWIVDDKGNPDTTRYKNRFVAWPNAGYVAKRLLFTYWSFSAYHNLKDASVTMTDEKGAAVPVEVQPYNPLYPMQTLVWKPEIDRQKVAPNTVYNVRIRAKDGKTWTYKVTVLDLNPSE